MYDNRNNFWQGKKVLVTGADGFIGSHLVERLVRLGADVRAFVYYNSFSSAGWLDRTDLEIRSNIEFIPGDIRDHGRVADAIQGCELVFHLASLIAIPYSYDAPESYVQTNIHGALNVLNACRQHQILKLIHTSTSEVYGSACYVPIDENHPLQGQSPYSASKIGADMLVQSFYQSYDLPVATARPFNTYGPRQSARAVIPTIMSQLLSGTDEIKLGVLHPTRDLNYVLDTVEGFLAIAESGLTVGRTINLGSEREITIGELVNLIIELSGRKASVVEDRDRIRPINSEVDRLLSNSSLAAELAGWRPKYTLEQGLKETLEWISDNLKLFDTTGYSI